MELQFETTEESISDRFYVYVFINLEWGEPFYVGKGSGRRCSDFRGRNNHVKSILNTYRCVSKVICEGLTEKQAYELEKVTKEFLKEQGKPIIDYECMNASIRQRQGVEKAKMLRKYKGSRPIRIDNTSWKKAYSKYKNHEINKSELAKELGISRPTLYKLLKEYSNYETTV